MNAENTLDRVLIALGMKGQKNEEASPMKFAQAKSEDGSTIFESESFAIGDSLFVVTEEGNIPAPQGEFILEDGKKVYTDEMGVIIEIASKEAEIAEGEAEIEAQNDMMKEQVEEAMAESPAAKGYPKKVVTSKTEMEESYFSSQLKKLEERIAKIEAEKISLSKENEDLKKALSSEPAPHSKFSPEDQSVPQLKFKIGARREENITDRVFKQLFS